jgi:two-component system cell cycle response regulator
MAVSTDGSSVYDDNKTDFVRAPDVQSPYSERTPVLLVIAGIRAGLTITIGDSPVVIGRAQHCSVWIEGAGISREHVRVARDSLGQVTMADLQSTNGTLVNRETIQHHTLAPGDLIQLGSSTTLKFEYQISLEESFHQQRFEQGLRDGLTGLYNRRHFLSKLREELVRVLKERRPVSMIKIAVDELNDVNERFGYEAEELVMRRLAKVITMGLGGRDLLARWGERKFAVLVHGGELEVAVLTAERIRKATHNYVIQWNDEVLNVTVSAGVASAEKDDLADMQDLLAEVDEYMTRARNTGGNQVVSRDRF